MNHAAKGILLALMATFALEGCRRAQPEAPPPPPREEPATAPAEDPDAAERARREAEERARAELQRKRTVLTDMVFFDYDRSDIRPDARATLDQKVPILREEPNVRLRIEGHADERGSVEYNLALGMRRAESVRQYLTGFGLDASRLEVISFGEERPLDPASNESAWARNRRAEFVILSGLATMDQP